MDSHFIQVGTKKEGEIERDEMEEEIDSEWQKIKS